MKLDLCTPKERRNFRIAEENGCRRMCLDVWRRNYEEGGEFGLWEVSCCVTYCHQILLVG